MAALLALRGLRNVKFGVCESSFGCLEDGMGDALVVRRELMRERGDEGEQLEIG